MLAQQDPKRAAAQLEYDEKQMGGVRMRRNGLREVLRCHPRAEMTRWVSAAPGRLPIDEIKRQFEAEL